MAKQQRKAAERRPHVCTLSSKAWQAAGFLSLPAKLPCTVYRDVAHLRATKAPFGITHLFCKLVVDAAAGGHVAGGWAQHDLLHSPQHGLQYGQVGEGGADGHRAQGQFQLGGGCGLGQYAGLARCTASSALHAQWHNLQTWLACAV